ncbi:MAG TPA: CPBP family intramembrane glutamic endopeptidase [Holophagaceae bacterium]|jgi:membrane protease YdiL (CAAX protease family)|nr:CPBP family intramembrane glutamic endopeptidase [Holophagaceae bacterium]
MREPLKLTKVHDPLLAILALLALLGVGISLDSRQKAPPEPASTTRTLKVLELQLGLGQKVEAMQPGISRKFVAAGKNLTASWDKAAWAVDAREAGDAGLAETLRHAAPAGPEGAAFGSAWAAAYEDGPLPAAVPAPLKDTRAAALLGNRLRARQGLAPLPVPEPDLVRLVLMGALVGLLFLGGLVTAVVLIATRKRPKPPQPQWRMDGRGALLVFLGWLVGGLFLLNTAVGFAFRHLPDGRLWALPAGYLCHAALGTWLLMRVEGLSFRELVARVAPSPRALRALAWAPAFVGLALVAVFCIALAWAPFMKGHANPQQEVQDLIAGARGLPLQASIFLTLAVLAPCFEELLFRGFLLPWAGERWGVAWGLAASSLLFGFIHLQPMALPILATLGFALGLAVRRGGSLWTSILVHSCWNGSIFVLMKM